MNLPHYTRTTAIVVLTLLLAGCGARSFNQTTTAAGQTTTAADSYVEDDAELSKAAAAIVLIEGDLKDRKYQRLGDISVSVSKNNAFEPDPTKALIDEQLRREAAKLKADAVINVVYDGPKVTLLSWGSMDGKGVAVKYAK